MRDFAYKERKGKGAVATSNKIAIWGWQIILLGGVFALVLMLFITLSTTRQQVEQQPVTEETPPVVEREEPLQFYQILPKPLEEESQQVQQSEQEDETTFYYRVESSLIQNQVNARSLKALLVFEGFNTVGIEEVEQDQQQWFIVTIDKIPTRSRMNQARDFLGNHDIDSVYTRIDR